MIRVQTLLALIVLSVGAQAADPPAKKPYVEPPSVRTLSFSPDGNLLAASVMPKDRGGQVFVWDVATRKLVSKYAQAGETPAAAFAADGKSIVLANGRTLLTRLDPRKGEKLGTIGPFDAEITTLARAGDAGWVTLGKDFAFRVWDDKDKKVLWKLAGQKRVWSWAVSASGKWLYASTDGQDRLWDLSTGKEAEGIFKVRQGTSNTGTFMGDDRLLLGSNHGTHKLVEIPSGKDLRRFQNEGGTGGMAYSPKTEMLACRYYTSMKVGLTPLTFRSPTEIETKKLAEFLKDCDSDDYATREKASESIVQMGSVLEPLLAKAALAGPSPEVRLRARVAREIILNKTKFFLEAHTEEIRPMTFSPDGKLFVTGGGDGLVILWDPATGKEIGRMNTGE